MFYIASGVFGTAAFAFLVICVRNPSRDVASQDLTSREAEILGGVRKQGIGYKSLEDTPDVSKGGYDSHELGSAEGQVDKTGEGTTRRFTHSPGDSRESLSADSVRLGGKSLAGSTTTGTVSDIHETSLKEN